MTLDWLYDGVNASVPRNAGKECAEYSSLKQKFVETVCVVTICVLAIKWTVKKLKPIASPATTTRYIVMHNSTNNLGTYSNNVPNYNNHHDNETTTTTINSNNNKNNINHNVNNTTAATTNRSSTCYYNGCVGGDGGKELLLTAMSIIFGIELGFKFASRSVIYVLNPCHITTIIQIYLLAAKPSKTVTVLFRIHMNYLNGPLLAFVFPETDSRTMTMEVTTYWLQHGLMFIIPIYLLRLGGVYTMEDVSDWSWNIISYALLLIYHFLFLTFFSIPTQVNLNHMLCPAIKDPFDGPYYRWAACVHQAILCPIICKIFCILFTPASKLYASGPTRTTTTSSLLSTSIISDNYDSVKKLLMNGSSGGIVTMVGATNISSGSNNNNIRCSDNIDNKSVSSNCSGSGAGGGAGGGVDSLYEKVKKLNNLNENGCDISKIE